MPRRSAPDAAFDELGREVRGLFNQLRAAAEAIHADHEALPIAQRAILESLHRDGPATVPALARARPVSRQHVQILVNALAGAGLVETRSNPGHRRSPIVALTPAGRRLFAAMRARERRAVAAQRLPVTDAEMRAAARVLRALRAHLAAALPPRG